MRKIGMSLLLTAAALIPALRAGAVPPCILTCPVDISQSNDSDECVAVVTYSAPTTNGSGICGTIVCTPASGYSFPVGPTQVNCSEDGISNGSCHFNVTVNDTQDPQITCPSDITAESDPGPINYAAPTVGDNCPSTVVSCTPPSGSDFPEGSTPVTCTATDASSNQSQCTFLVTLTPPTGGTAGDTAGTTGGTTGGDTGGTSGDTAGETTGDTGGASDNSSGGCSLLR